MSDNQGTICWLNAEEIISTQAAACPLAGRGAVLCNKASPHLSIYCKIQVHIYRTTNSPDILASDYIIPTEMSRVKF